MKSNSQTALLALIVLFTMALAITVSWLSISSLPTPTRTGGSSSLASTDSHTVAPESELPTEAPTEPFSKGLLFSPNGDGSCTLAGLGSCTDASVVIPAYAPTGERVTAIAPMAFYGVRGVSAIQLPSTVIEIGALAFADCQSLVYIAVHPDNLYFCDRDGVLYSADQATLIVYPPMRAGSEVWISVSTVRIRDMAFYRCENLSRVRYGGTAAEWESIRIGARNYSLTAAAKEFEAN